MKVPHVDVTPQGSNGSCHEEHLVRTIGKERNTNSEPSYCARAKAALFIEDEALLRGMPVQHALRSFATVLSSRPATAEYFELSKPVGRIGTFISHNWSTPRLQKWIVLCLHYNLIPALLSACIAAAAACALTIVGALPTISTDHRMKEDQEGYTYLQGIAALPAGLVTFIIVLLGFHEFDRCCLTLRRDTVFLDKTCVHQTDEELKRKGIRCLAGILACSRDMLVMYSDIYLQRLWTCYEVASWLMLHKGVRVAVRPVFVPPFVLAGCLIFTLWEAAFLAMGVVNSYVVKQLVSFSAIMLCLLPTWTAASALGAKATALRDRMEGHASKFSLAKAECAKEEDRVVVQQGIADFMRYVKCCDPSASDEEVILAFEKMVQNQVPQQIRSSFGRLGVPYDYFLVCALPHTLVTFDYFAGAMVQGTSFRAAMMQVTMHLVTALAGAPMLTAVQQWVQRRGRCRGLAGCVALGCLNTVLLAAEIWVLNELRFKATDSDLWLAVLLLFSAVQSIVTAILYRPLPRHLGQRLA